MKKIIYYIIGIIGTFAIVSAIITFVKPQLAISVEGEILDNISVLFSYMPAIQSLNFGMIVSHPFYYICSFFNRAVTPLVRIFMMPTSSILAVGSFRMIINLTLSNQLTILLPVIAVIVIIWVIVIATGKKLEPTES